MKRNLFRLSGRRRAVAAGLLVVIVTGVALTFFINVRQAKAIQWWNTGWNYRKKITFDNSASSGALSDFPVRVSLSSSNINYGHTQNAGQDIRFVDDNDATPLKYEIEKWDESGTSEVWVKVTSLANTNTDFIWMYYGNGSATDAQDPTNVWNANFAGVWHSGETSGTVLNDSTSNNNDGAKASSTSPNPNTGKIGGSQLYSASVVTVPDANSLDMNNDMTISAWVNTASLLDWATVVCKDTSFNPNYCIQNNQSDKLEFNYSSTFLSSPMATTLSLNTWYYITAVYDNAANQVRMYLNGTLDSTTTQTTALPPNNNSMTIGSDFINEDWDGSIDELRISNNIRTADWTRAEYLTDNNAMNSFGAEEQYPPDPPVLSNAGTSAALQPVLQLRAADPVDPDYLRYKIEVCSNSDCSSIIRTIDQTSSQTGWSGQDVQSGTAYASSATVGSSTLATHTYQTPALSPGTQYWWRAYAKDPAGSNTWSDVSQIGTFITTGPPAAPTLIDPIGGARPTLAPMLRAWTTDPNGDYVKYKFDVCQDSSCSTIIRTIDQTASQTGWSSQDASSATAYTAAVVLANSQQAVHAYQSPSLNATTQYWWRAYAIDIDGYNQWSSASSIGTFTTNKIDVKLLGGTTIKGGTRIGQ